LTGHGLDGPFALDGPWGIAAPGASRSGRRLPELGRGSAELVGEVATWGRWAQWASDTGPLRPEREAPVDGYEWFSVAKRLHRSVPALVVDERFFVVVARVSADHAAPESDRRMVRFTLANLPAPAK